MNDLHNNYKYCSIAQNFGEYTRDNVANSIIFIDLLCLPLVCNAGCLLWILVSKSDQT